MPAAGPAAPPAPGSGGGHPPTAAAFPAQYGDRAPQAPPPPGAPVGPFAPYASAGPQPFAGQAPPPAYGYPQAPAPGLPPYGGYGYPGSPAPVVRRRNPVLLYGGIVVGVLGVAIVIGLVILFGGNGGNGDRTADGGTGGGDGAASGYNTAWTAAKPPSGSSGSMLGAWTTDKLAVRGDGKAITAYNLADGTSAWTIAPPAGVKEFCSMSAAANSRRIAAVSLNTGDGDCSTLGAVDLGTGKLLWFKKVGTEKIYSPTLSVTDKVVALGSSSSLGAFAVADGAPAWTYQPRDENCSVYASAAGNTIVVSDRCYSSKITTKSVLQVLDAESGKAATQVTLSGTSERLSSVISAKPLVVEMSNGSDGDYLMGFDSAGKPTAKLPTKEAGSDSLQFSDASDPFTLDVVSGSTLYVQNRSGEKYAIEAFDLTGGKKLWEQAGTGRQGLRLVSGTDKDGAVRAVSADGYNDPARLVKLGPADGAVTDIAPITVPKNQLMIYSLTQFVIGDDGAMTAFTRSSGTGPVMRFTRR
ncbi:PQQ-binding-like beta-propeller repeat protein [Kitasatospora sp. NBC_00315]|uniref:outer membrane protein assembly factor BamB family protein n=1 Tax=Kitasatospora sp. NBC_00315 TaxID=2975963 RepID=UPI00324F9A7F